MEKGQTEAKSETNANEMGRDEIREKEERKVQQKQQNSTVLKGEKLRSNQIFYAKEYTKRYIIDQKHRIGEIKADKKIGQID